MPTITPRLALQTLLDSDLDFANANTRYAAHAIHAFAAKFPPQLPRLFISELSEHNETILDPMMGSGTTILEALLLGRKAIGFDIDPLAVKITGVKTNSLDIFELFALIEDITTRANELCRDRQKMLRSIQERYSPKTKEFFDYWFNQSTQVELMALVLCLERAHDVRMRNLLEVIFSSIIVTKSGGVSLARDLAHSRPHRVQNKNCHSAIQKFREKADKTAVQVGNLSGDLKPHIISYADSRKLPLSNDSVDLIVTSPPYVNAIDYVRAHKFSLSWLGYPIESLTNKRREYIGSEKYNNEDERYFPEKVRNVLECLKERDKRKSKIARKYFSDMKIAFGEMHRVLKPGKIVVIVIGTSTIRNMNVETHICLARLAEQVGFEVVDIAERNLDRNKRMMPARFGGKQSSIELRMHSEYVVGLLKQR